MKTIAFIGACILAAFQPAVVAEDMYLTFENGLIVNTFTLDSNQTEISMMKYDQEGYPEGGELEGAVQDFGEDIKALVELIKGIKQTGLTPDVAQQIIKGIKKAIQDGYAAAKQGGDIIERIQNMIKNGASLADSQFLITAIQEILQDILKLIDSQPIVCRRRLIGRGIGSIPEQKCLDGEEKTLGMCYPKCKNEFESVIGFICRRQGCGGVDGAKDWGISCTKPAAYGRGVGYFTEAKCVRENSQGCEKNGLLHYPKCKAGYHAFGCCICTPNCPAGYKDDGAFCRKEHYIRTGTSRPVCPTGKEKSVGLCYPPCAPEQDGLGPICSPKCTGEAPTQCGLFCTSSAAACAGAVVEIVGDGTKILLSAISQDFTGVIKAAVQLGKYIIQMKKC